MFVINERGLTSADGAVYNNNTKRTRYSSVPSSDIATRPLAIRKDGTWYAYGWDLTKNICEVFGHAGYIRTSYTYSPFGEVTASGDVSQPIQWSSEFFDCETSTNYYNYRYYHPEEARWLSRDSVVENSNDYIYINNKMQNFDIMGAEEYEGISDTISIPKLDEYFGLENGIDLFRVTIIESDSKLTQKIKKNLIKASVSSILLVWLKNCAKVRVGRSNPS